jgi:hypothetical protein
VPIGVKCIYGKTVQFVDTTYKIELLSLLASHFFLLRIDNDGRAEGFIVELSNHLLLVVLFHFVIHDGQLNACLLE